MSGKNSKSLCLTIPIDLYNKAKKISDSEYKTVNTFIKDCIVKRIDWLNKKKEI